MRKILAPVIYREQYGAIVEREILAWFNDVIFQPLFQMLHDAKVAADPGDQAIEFDETGKRTQERINAGSDVIVAALRAGRIWYADGTFGTATTFGSEISRELRALGAHYDQDRHLFVLAATDIPYDLRGAIDSAQARAIGVHEQMKDVLGSMAENAAIAPVGLKLASPIDRILKDLSDQFDKSVKGVESITVSPELQPAVRTELTKGFTENLDLYIKNFANEEIPELRQMVERNLMAGGRLDKLSKMIEAQYGVTKRKANFLAYQETSLLTAKFRMERAKNVGSVSYIWHTRQDNRVRDDHQPLDKKVFFWDDPPVVDVSHGRHANPGEDYNCRCYAEPIIELPATADVA